MIKLTASARRPAIIMSLALAIGVGLLLGSYKVAEAYEWTKSLGNLCTYNQKLRVTYQTGPLSSSVYANFKRRDGTTGKTSIFYFYCSSSNTTCKFTKEFPKDNNRRYANWTVWSYNPSKALTAVCS